MPRRVTALDVVCGACGAQVGMRCRRLDDGSVANSQHEVRRTHAKRLNDELNPVHVTGQMPLWGKR